jgi:uncharacterized membrane protein
MLTWLVPAIFASFAWGLWAFLQKTAGTQVNPLTHSLVQGFVSLLVTALLFVILKQEFTLDGNKAALSAFGGIVICCANLAFLIAMSRGSVGIVVPLTALYPVFSILIGALVLKEVPNAPHTFGMFLAGCALFFLTR